MVLKMEEIEIKRQLYRQRPGLMLSYVAPVRGRWKGKATAQPLTDSSVVRGRSL